MTEKAIICLSLHYEDIVTEQGEKNGNLYMTIRTVPQCKLESCQFSNDSGVWCPLKEVRSLRERRMNEGIDSPYEHPCELLWGFFWGLIIVLAVTVWVLMQ